MDSTQGASSNNVNFDFNAAMDFSGFGIPPTDYSVLKASEQGNTNSDAFYFDEGIDTMGTFDPIFGSNGTGFGMQQPLSLDNTTGSASWGSVDTTTMNSFPPTPVQSFDSLFTPQYNTSLGKRSLPLDAQDFSQSKRHESVAAFSPYPTSASVTGSGSWAVDTQPTPSSSSDVGLSDEAADMCATWFGKYNILPSDRHIDSLSQLTGESATAIRQWFGQALKQGINNDSAYKSQTGFTRDPILFPGGGIPSEIFTQETVADIPCNHDAQTTTTAAAATTATSRSPLRGGKKGCNPTNDPDMLKRDPNKIYQCTRKCGKRYGRKCDWKRNEEEGYPAKSWICSLCISEKVERVKPCFRKYHLAQHFRNIHPDEDPADYEEASFVQSDTTFPRKCGFCAHRFDSRQDRIDHIAEHFKSGKCMLDWNDDDEDNNDSDNMDDDDDNNNDKPDSGGFDSNQPFFSPDHDSQGSSGSKHNGNGGGSYGGQQPPQSGYFQFQLSQANDADTRGASPGADQRIKTTVEQRETRVSHATETDEQHPGLEQCGLQEQCSMHGRNEAAEELDSNALARDAVSPLSEQRVSSGNAAAEARPAKVNQEIRSQGLKSILQDGLNVTRVESIQDGRSTCTPPPPDIADDGTPSSGLSSIPTEAKSWLRKSILEGLLSDKPLDFSSMAEDLSQKLDMSNESVDTGLQVHLPLSNVPPQSSYFGRKLTVKQQWRSSVTNLLDSQSFLSVKLLGAGGFSTVDEVVHRETSLRISRKTLKNRDQTALEEVKKEVNVLQKLRHPHIIRFLDAYSRGDKMSILLSPVAETTLGLWLDNKLLSRPEGLAQTVVKMLGCLSSSLRYLHEQRPVVKHMDIKPQNILVMQGTQEFPHVVLTDFGISSDEQITVDGKQQPLTRQYCAPEVSEGISREQAADIWSLGCVFAEMATVAFSDDNPHWLDFRQQYRGHEGKYYWQDPPDLQDWFTQFLGEATSLNEATVVRTVRSMLKSEPTERPSAAKLTMIFTPAPCCLSWPNDKASYPGPAEELQTAEMLVYEGDIDCRAQLHLHGGTNDKQPCQSIAHAKSWLDKCSHDHEACRQQLSGAKALPRRLVDIHPPGADPTSVRIVDGAQLDGTDYVALSYVWSLDEYHLSTDRLQATQGELPREILPRAIQEAITAAERIGYRYIWVDSLCVLQDSREDKERECLTFADIYRNAALTIVLDQLKNIAQPYTKTVPNCSISSSSCDAIKQESTASASLPAIDYLLPGFAWDTRAWSLQERLLSRRLLHLGEQMYWECNALKASETFPRGLSPLLWEKVHTKTSAMADVKSATAGSNTTTPTGQTSADKARAENPRLLRNCQWIKKEGDGIGESMETAQAQLELRGTLDDRAAVDVGTNVESVACGNEQWRAPTCDRAPDVAER